VSATNRACRDCGIWRTTRHTDKRTAALHCCTAADRRPTNQVSAWQAERGSRPTRPTRATSSYHPREDVTCQRGCHEDATRKLLPWNLGYYARFIYTRPSFRRDVPTPRYRGIKSRRIDCSVSRSTLSVCAHRPAVQRWWSLVTEQVLDSLGRRRRRPRGSSRLVTKSLKVVET